MAGGSPRKIPGINVKGVPSHSRQPSVSWRGAIRTSLEAGNQEEDMAIGNPVEWGSNYLGLAASAVRSSIHAIHRPEDALRAPLPVVRKIKMNDLKDALAQGLQDFALYRTHVLFLCVIYPIIGLVLARLVIGQGLFQMLFPLASGFALVGPFIAIGLYEMSRRREQGDTVNWATAFQVLRLPSSGAIALLGLLLTAIFVAWLFAAQTIYGMTLGQYQPASIAAFAHDVFATTAGWILMGAGVSIGFVFVVIAFAISVVSCPLLLDHDDIGFDVAIGTSIQAVRTNPWPMAVWGMIVAGSLAVGSAPFFIGLAVVFPVLGHATWHLYRKLVPS
jgi:uncharacterized membrane protein